MIVFCVAVVLIIYMKLMYIKYLILCSVNFITKLTDMPFWQVNFVK